MKGGRCMKKLLEAIALLLVSSFVLWGCVPEELSITSKTDDVSVISTETTVSVINTEQAETTTFITSSASTNAVSTITSTATTEPVTTTVKIEAVAPTFSLSNIPEYSGSPYIEINNNVPFFTEYPTQSFEIYSPLDSLGRCGVAYANISEELMPTEKRTEIGAIKPSGWHTANYSDLIEDIYLYNRCHLIGYQLAGENDNERNLITGTRYMNIEGMEPFENKVANFVRSYNAHVLYRVTPEFDGDNLVASGVLMEAYSLDDNGAGIQFCVYCYNVQPNIGINYADGESWRIIQEPDPVEVIPDRSVMPEPDTSVTYVLNTNTRKFHYPSCSSVNSMKDKNKDFYTGSRDDVIAMGYEPCKRCNP